MAWASSAIFQAAMGNPILQHVNPGSLTSPTGYTDLVATDVINVALYNNTGTPDKTAAVTLTGYGAATSQWVTANEVTDPNWPAGGLALGTKAFSLDTGSSSWCFRGASVANSSTATLLNVYGCLVYDNSITAGTVSKQGLCYNYFGGVQSVTGGTFTVAWATPAGAAVTAVWNVAI